MEAAERTGEEVPERWSARGKTESVLAVEGRGDGTVSREMQVPVHGDPAHAGTIVTRGPMSCGGRTWRASTPSAKGVLVLRHGRSLHDRGDRLARGEDRGPLGRPSSRSGRD